MAFPKTTTEKMVVVVLAWNHFEDTRECLLSMLASTGVQPQVIVVDNGSTDGTSQKIQAEFPTVRLVRSEKNLGVSGGYNLGLRQALQEDADTILIANNDIAVDPGMLSALADCLQANPQAGIAMPKIYHYYGDRTRVWTIGARWRSFPPTVKLMAYNAPDRPAYQTLRQIDYAPSCCYLLRRAVVERVGLFDEGYFFYFDDWDYSARVNQAGFTIWLAPDAKMWHKVSLSTQKSDKPFEWWQYMGRSAYRFYSKYCSKLQLVLFSAWFFIREILKLKPLRSIAYLKGVFQEASLTRDHQKGY
jgi:GT2 family glycosyltransferase